MDLINNTNDSKTVDEKEINPKVAKLFQYPIDLLSEETKEKLKLLDCNFIIHDDQFARKDFRGLAMLVGYDVLGLNYLIDYRGCISPTMMILEKMRKEDKTLGHLVLYLRQLGRFDILAHVKCDIIKDISLYKQQCRLNHAPRGDLQYGAKPKLLQAESRVVTPVISTSVADGCDEDGTPGMGFVTDKETVAARNSINQYFTTDIVDNNTKKSKCPPKLNQPITFEDSNRQIKIYDVFISFDSETEHDVQKMMELCTHLEQAGITVAKGSFSFFQGVCLTEAYAQAIYSRCRKVILLLSNSYIQSETCLMQLNFARDSDKALWHRKVIPVYIEPIKTVPPAISNINGFKYYDKFCRQNYLQSFVQQMKM